MHLLCVTALEDEAREVPGVIVWTSIMVRLINVMQVHSEPRSLNDSESRQIR